MWAGIIDAVAYSASMAQSSPYRQYPLHPQAVTLPGYRNAVIVLIVGIFLYGICGPQDIYADVRDQCNRAVISASPWSVLSPSSVCDEITPAPKYGEPKSIIGMYISYTMMLCSVLAIITIKSDRNKIKRVRYENRTLH